MMKIFFLFEAIISMYSAMDLKMARYFSRDARYEILYGYYLVFTMMKALVGATDMTMMNKSSRITEGINPNSKVRRSEERSDLRNCRRPYL